MNDSTHSWVLTATLSLFNQSFPFWNWQCHTCFSWLIKQLLFYLNTLILNNIVYLTILMLWRIIHRMYKMFYWYTGGGSFRCSSVLCLFLTIFFSFEDMTYKKNAHFCTYNVTKKTEISEKNTTHIFWSVGVKFFLSYSCQGCQRTI